MNKDDMKDITEALFKIGECLHSALIPEESISHFRRAAKEMLLGIVAILETKDKRGARDNDSQQQAKSKNKSQKIDITE